MAIKKIRISNFKSFNDLEIELGNFNVLVGANASGKSNFIQIFRFLKDIANEGLENAISMQGGVEYLRNVNIGSSENFSLEVVFDFEQGSDRMFTFINAETGEWDINGKIYKLIYELDIRFNKENSEFEICKDKIIEECTLFKLEKDVGKGEVISSIIDGKLVDEFKNFPAEGVCRIKNPPPTILIRKLPPNTLLPETYLFKRIINDISICDFDPKLSKKAISILGKAELEEDGGNLALVLKNAIEDKDKKREFDNLIKYLLPFVEDVSIERFAEQFLLLKLQETYSKEHSLPAFLLSDGTINMIALIIALYFEKKPLTIIEEPERNIHPYLISKVVNMMKDASRNKQIIVTTHNPEIVKHADLEDILLITRDKEGFSTISRPVEKKEVQIFLKNEIGIEDLYIQNLLEI